MAVTDLAITDEAIEQNTTEFERSLFDGEKVVTLEIQVLQKTYDQILAALARQGLEPEGGLRIMLTLGMGYLEALNLLQPGDATQDRPVHELMELESKAAVMKYHAYDYMRDNKIMEMRMNATQSMAKDYEQAIWRLRAENETLNAENEALREQLEQAQSNGNSATETGLKTAQPTQASSRSIDRRLRRQRR